jgi:hypothetical protein
MLTLRLSDLVSGGLCVAYDSVIGRGVTVENFIEQVAYRSLGRGVNQVTSLPKVDLPLVHENDIYCGLVAVGDNAIRQGYRLPIAGFQGARATVSSAAADYLMQALNVNEKVFF